VSAASVSSIASTTATGNGSITSLGDANPTAYGICWNTTGTPTISDSKVSNGAASATGAFTASMTGLTANTTYHVRAYATNAAGTSYGSEVSFTTKSAQTITFAAPEAQNFGTTPTLAATASSTLAVSFTSSTTGVCTITSGGALSFVSTGTCTINADQAGNATYTAAPTVTHSFSVAAVAPAAPTIGSATAGDGSASISFTAPASTGGATITGYTVTSTPGGLTGTGTTSPIAVAGLTNGTAYTFTVTATNSAGTSTASAATSSVTPIGSQSITFAALPSVTYGSADIGPGATSSASLVVSYASSVPSVATIVDGKIHVMGVGTTTITASQVGNASYAAATPVSQSLAVTSAPLTITANNATKALGAADPVFTANVAGLVNGETETVVKGLVFNRAPGTAANDYAIIPSGATAANYVITYVNGTLTILPGTTGIATHPVTAAPRSTQLAASTSHPFASVASGLGEGKLGTNLFGCTEERCLSLELALPSAATMHVTIFDQLGTPVISWNEVFTAADLARIGTNPDGRTSVTLSWNLRASNGAAVGSGVYLWKVEALTVDGQRLETVKKMGVK